MDLYLLLLVVARDRAHGARHARSEPEAVLGLARELADGGGWLVLDHGPRALGLVLPARGAGEAQCASAAREVEVELGPLEVAEVVVDEAQERFAPPRVLDRVLVLTEFLFSPSCFAGAENCVSLGMQSGVSRGLSAWQSCAWVSGLAAVGGMEGSDAVGGLAGSMAAGGMAGSMAAGRMAGTVAAGQRGGGRDGGMSGRVAAGGMAGRVAAGQRGGGRVEGYARLRPDGR